MSSASAAANVAMKGSVVKVNYTGKFADSGEVFDTSEGKEPIELEVGSGRVIRGFESALVGMAPGDKVTVEIAAEEAYGERHDNLIFEAPLDKLPEDVEEGHMLTAESPEGAIPVTVVSIDKEGKVAKMDANHPLAGKALKFDIEVVDVQAPAPTPEVKSKSESDSGLVIETTHEGDGKTFPTAGAKVSVHYVGTLAETGKQFDSSRDRGDAFEFNVGVGQVIAGWDEGVMKMSLGQRAILRIPASLGYGASGAGGVIPPNADLVFDVEVLAIN